MKKRLSKLLLILSYATSLWAQNLSTLEGQHQRLLTLLNGNLSPEQKIETVLFQHAQLETKLDKLFYAYASCFPIEGDKVLNFTLLKSIAYAESRLNLYAGSCNEAQRRIGFPVDEPEPGPGTGRTYGRCRTYKGLFQENQTYCEAAFNQFHRSGRGRLAMPASYGEINCQEEGRLDPDQNTLVATYQFSRNYKTIKRACPNATEENIISLLYIGHNDGVGILRRHVLKIGTNETAACNASEIENNLRQYYMANHPRQIETRMSKFRTGRSVIIPFSQRRGMSTNLITVPANIRRAVCPINHGARLHEKINQWTAQR